MEKIFGVIWALFNWRLLLCIFSPIAVALGLSKAFAFNPGLGMLFNLFLLGTCFGVVWQTRSEAGVKLTAPVQSSKVSKPIAFLCLAVVGALLGAIESSIFGSAILGALALVVAVAIIALWNRFALRREISLSYLIFLAASLLIGFSGLLLLNLLYAM
jgi:hypothetical protein